MAKVRLSGLLHPCKNHRADLFWGLQSPPSAPPALAPAKKITHKFADFVLVSNTDNRAVVFVFDGVRQVVEVALDARLRHRAPDEAFCVEHGVLRILVECVLRRVADTVQRVNRAQMWERRKHAQALYTVERHPGRGDPVSLVVGYDFYMAAFVYSASKKKVRGSTAGCGEKYIPNTRITGQSKATVRSATALSTCLCMDTHVVPRSATNTNQRRAQGVPSTRQRTNTNNSPILRTRLRVFLMRLYRRNKEHNREYNKEAQRQRRKHARARAAGGARCASAIAGLGAVVGAGTSAGGRGRRHLRWVVGGWWCGAA